MRQPTFPAVSTPVGAANPRRLRGRRALAIGIAISLLTATMVTAYATTSEATTYSFFSSTDVSGVPTDPDNRPVELGLRFTSRRAGTLDAVRFLKAPGDLSPHRVTVWTGNGQTLASAVPHRESPSGWQQVPLAAKVRIEPGREYVVSYHTSRYRASEDYFANRTVKAGLLSTTGAGVYAYGAGGFPTNSWKASNYWVDVVFVPTTAPAPTQSPTAVPSASATSVPSPSPTLTSRPASPSPSVSTSAPGAGVSLDLPRVPWEGGPSYYANFPPAQRSGFADRNFFPVGVWFESVLEDRDVALDKSVGLNTYIELTSNSDLGLMRRNGMRAMISEQLPGRGDESVAWLLADEVDMWAGPGSGRWTGNWPGEGQICATREPCGYDVLQRLSSGFPTGDGRMRYANFGKGVMFWESDSQASKFVNQYTNVVSNDIYWYTDPGVCRSASEGPTIGVTAETCRRAANYGRTMDRMRKLDAMDGKRQPVYAFVEVGHPFTEASAPTITGDQIAGAVMNSLIHEARGLIYFNHNFGGSCISQHVLRDACGAAVRPAVTETNRRVTTLAPVLNTQSYVWTFNAELDTMLKGYGGSYYVFAMPGRDGVTGTQKLQLPPGMGGRTAEVLFENRTVPISGGILQDTFSKESSYHIYKITP